MLHADGNLKRRICPFISSGQFVQFCKGAACNAAKPCLIEEDTIWVCSLIEKARSGEDE